MKSAIQFLFAFILILVPGLPGRAASTLVQEPLPAACRFGITAPYSSAGYPLESLGAGAFLDWRADGSDSLPPGMDYIRVLRVQDTLYPDTLAGVPGWVAAHFSSVWIIGNEPDRYYYQDSITPEVYAQRYYQLATLIRALDPSARLGFGSVVQPTPIRLVYLERALQELADLAGSPQAASALIDIWSIHSFILNEHPDFAWGAGIPVGLAGTEAPLLRIDENHFGDTHSSSIFSQRVIDFRTWLKAHGEQDKPLWITEYGSLFPPIDPPGGPNYVNVSDADTAAYLLATFNFLTSAIDPSTGMPSDGDRLVQRWFWYSLNDHRYVFGGALFDPDSGRAVTPVGAAWQAYSASHPLGLDVSPGGLDLVSQGISPDGLTETFQVILHLLTTPNSHAGLPLSAWLYDGSPDVGGTLIAGPLAGFTSMSGESTLSASWTVSLPRTARLVYARVDLQGCPDDDPANNQAAYLVFPLRLHLAQVLR